MRGVERMTARINTNYKLLEIKNKIGITQRQIRKNTINYVDVLKTKDKRKIEIARSRLNILKNRLKQQNKELQGAKE